MAETNALLKRHTGNRIEGSNPSVSATGKSSRQHAIDLGLGAVAEVRIYCELGLHANL